MPYKEVQAYLVVVSIWGKIWRIESFRRGAALSRFKPIPGAACRECVPVGRADYLG
jgi:hypothetical protein